MTVPLVSWPAARVSTATTTWRPLFRLSAVLVCVYLATGMVSALIPLRIVAVTHAYGQLAATTSVYAGAGIGASYGWGWLADRLHRRVPFVLGGLVGLGLAYASYLVAGSFPALLLTRTVEGAALAAYNVGSVTLIGDYVAHHRTRGRLLGAYRTGGSLAFGLTMLTSGTVADRLGPRVPFLCAALFMVLGCLLAVGLREARPVEAVEPGARDGGSGDAVDRSLRPREPIAAAVLASLLVGVLGWHLILTAVYSVWPNYLSSLGYTRTAITQLWGLASLSEVPFMLIMGVIADRIGYRRMLALALVVLGLVVGGYAVVPQLPWIAVVQVVRAVAWSAFLTASLALTVEASSHARRGRLTGLVTTAGAVGDVAGAAIGGTLVGSAGFVVLLWGGSVSAWGCGVLVLLARSWPARQRRS